MYPYPCLYCSDTARDRTSEHVVQKSFGGNLTLPQDVCGHCNTTIFSSLDDELVKFVRSLIFWDHPAVTPKRLIIQDHGLMLDEQTGFWLSVRIEKSGKPIVFPQIIFPDHGGSALILDANKDAKWRERAEQIHGELARIDTTSLERSIVRSPLGDSTPPLQTALIRSSPGKYIIRARDDEKAAGIEVAIKNGALTNPWAPNGSPQYHSQAGWVHLQLKWDLGAIERALAKTALNFVCATVGSAVARKSEFDDIRQFSISTYDVKRAGFIHFAFGDDADPAFVQMVKRFSRSNHHTLLLAPADGFPLVVIALYGRPFAVVRLTKAPAPHALPADTVVVGMFDYTSKTHEIIHMSDDPLDFHRRFFGEIPVEPNPE